MKFRFGATALSLLFTLTACAGGGGRGGSAIPETPDASPMSILGSHIKHIVVIVQENRSFDNIYAGFPGAATQSYGYWGTTKIPLHKVGFVIANRGQIDMIHNWHSARVGWDGGKMDGFGDNTFGTPTDQSQVKSWPYAYLNRAEVKPYWDMASQYVLSDHMFATMFGGSFTAHVDLISGTTDLKPKLSEVDWPNQEPWGCDAPRGTTSSVLAPGGEPQPGAGPFPCFTQFKTMADTLDAAHVTWKYYVPGIRPAIGSDPGGLVWSEFSAIKSVRHGPDWAKIVSPPTTVLADAAAGNLPQMTWVIPDFKDSDHSAGNSDEGPSWVAAVVNAIGKGPDWNSTAIVIVWDDWGGWYDHLPPPQLDWKGLGVRVPAIVISPFAKKGYVDHTQYEFSSILKLVEQTFNLPVVGAPSFGYTDTRATSMTDAFDFTQKPRAFVKIHSKYPASHFANERPSMRAPDDD
jgi:phospholipase C